MLTREGTLATLPYISNAEVEPTEFGEVLGRGEGGIEGGVTENEVEAGAEEGSLDGPTQRHHDGDTQVTLS